MKSNTAPSSTAAFAGVSSRLERLSYGVQAALIALRAYKLLVSPLFVGSCRFAPSCSDYAADAVRAHGVLRGGLLAARRLVRCQPLCAGGHDPVPPRM